MDSNRHVPAAHQRSSDDDGTYVGEDLSHQHSNTSAQANPPRIATGRPRSGTHLTVETQYDQPHQMQSPSQTREQASRLDDDLAVLQIERGILDAESLDKGHSVTRSMQRVRSRRDEPIDDFDAATNPLHEQAARYKPPANPTTKFSKFFKRVHNSSWLVRYFTYITPLVLLILIPLLVGALAFPDANVGGVELVWFSIWLMIVWLTLWAGRVSVISLSFSFMVSSDACLASRKTASVAHRSCLQSFHKQQQEVERYGKTARAASDIVLLVVGN